jgi:hypothetical protein
MEIVCCSPTKTKEKSELDLRTLGADKFELTGVFFGDSVAWKFNRIDLEGLAIFE